MRGIGALVALASMAASSAPGGPSLSLPGPAPLLTCPECGSESRKRYCTGNGHHRRRIPRPPVAEPDYKETST